MRRRTPLIALILAPIALWAVVIAWNRVLLPLSVKMWRSEPVVQARIAVGDPETRVKAMREAAVAKELDESTVGTLLESARTERNALVRAAALRGLGAIGARQPLPEAATRLFGELILTERDDALLVATLEAAGKAAAHNRVDEGVVRHLARQLGEKRLSWLYPAAIEALGRIGAAQPLPEDVLAALHARFVEGARAGEREDLARAFAAMAEGQKLPEPLLDELAATLAGERNYRIRVHAVYALARSDEHYPQSRSLVAAANEDPHQNVRSAAAHAERVNAARKLYANRTPIEVAQDASLPLVSRLEAMGPLKVNRKDAAWREGVLKLARDAEPRIAAAALELFPHVSGGPDDPFDKSTLIPQLVAAMSHADPQVRRAAYGTLGRHFVVHPGYRHRAQDFGPQLEAGANDADAKVRTIALATMLRARPGDPERQAIVKRGLEDADPYVRSIAAGWLASPRTEVDAREALLARAQRDADANVRRSAAAAMQEWQGRERSWPVELWQLWQAGERAKVGFLALTAATVAAPVLVGFAFLIYFMARLLTYLFERRWRALAVLPVVGAWAAASYGMFLLYFMAAHAGGHMAAWQTIQLAGILWIAIALYAVAGWGLHYAVRR